MSTLVLQLTDAGLAAIQAAEGSDPAEIAELGLTATPFIQSPTLLALPGEFKRLDALSGTPTAPNVVHMTAYDISADTYSATGLGLFLADGTLLATFTSEDVVMNKAALAFSLFAFDLVFENDLAASISFGDAVFLYPAATEEMPGVAPIATQARVDALADAAGDEAAIVTPKTLRARLTAFATTVNAALGAFAVRTITGGGLVTGGGDLSDSRVLTVTAANSAEVAAGIETGKAVTPAAMATMPQDWGSVIGLGGSIMKHGTVSISFPAGGSVTFPVAFPGLCDRVLLTPLGNINEGDEDDETWWVGGVSASGFSIGCAANGLSASFAWVAFGH